MFVVIICVYKNSMCLTHIRGVKSSILTSGSVLNSVHFSGLQNDACL
jgi:hypothetical protein